MAKFHFLLATGNSHKQKEFEQLFSPELVSVAVAPTKIEVDENGTNFTENALLKAEAYYQKFKAPVLSDDSGLSVLSLPNELGVQSARFGGTGLTDRNRAELLLKKMSHLSSMEERKAFFTAVLCFYFSPEEIYFFEGKFHGYIGHHYSELGDDFGYDPVFIPEARLEEGRAVSELSEWKNIHSHRAQAVKFAQNFLKSKI